MGRRVRSANAGGGWVRSYAGADVYYSQATGAHEVHGDIRKKYDVVNGPAWLGLPTTDELGTPDGRGRFNHFASDASIYWTSSTGPMIVRNAIRAYWAANGWERGPWGYPVADEQRIPGLYPDDSPNVAWSAFENGMGFSQAAGCLPAVSAVVTQRELGDAVRSMIDSRLPTFDITVGLISTTIRPGLKSVEFLGLDNWSYGFWGPVPRTLGLRLSGFVSVPVSDPTFEVDLWLRFSTVWPTASFTYPAAKTIIATLARYSVRVEGVASDAIAEVIQDNLREAFNLQQPDVPSWSILLSEVSTGADQHGSGAVDFLDVMLMEDGALRVFLNPLPPSLGAVRQSRAQEALTAALGQLH